MHVLASTVIVILLCDIAVTLGVLYLLPVLTGWLRQVPDLGMVAVINVLLGWTIVGWVCALAMALRSMRPGAAGQVVSNLHAPSPPPAGRSQACRRDLAPFRDGCPPPLQLPPRPSGPGAAN